jgi:proteasome activator subunit 4
MIPSSVIEDDLQHTMHYSQSLPYAHLLEGEAEEWLKDIRNNLVICVKAKDFAPGAVAWVRRLTR